MIHWIQAPSGGRIAVIPRPRGGEWIDREIRCIIADGANVLVSCLELDEITELELSDELGTCSRNGIEFINLPIPDRSIPRNGAAFAALTSRLFLATTAGKSVAIHCRQGIGRSSLIAASILLRHGLTVSAAFEAISITRKCKVPETLEQIRYVENLDQGFIDPGCQP
jgi:protein-tyrosine phosphatase